MTLDNQPAFIQVGQRVPRVTATQTNQVGQIINSITNEDVGLILGVTPRISPDGLVVMEIDAEKSELGLESEGVPISVSVNGDVLRSPRSRKRRSARFPGRRSCSAACSLQARPTSAAGCRCWQTFRSWAICSATTAH